MRAISTARALTVCGDPITFKVAFGMESMDALGVANFGTACQKEQRRLLSFAKKIKTWNKEGCNRKLCS